MLDEYIVYQDESLLVINKPSGIVVNRSNTWHKDTVQDLVESYVNLSGVDVESDFFKRTGIVHRIDKETSGLLIIAKDAESFNNIQDQFKNREVHKEYLALVFGKFPSEKIQVNAPIKRSPRNRMKFAVVADGRPAMTEFKLQETIEWENEILSIVNCMPKTGRTHQIRVHLTALNHPIVGDHLYLGKKRFLKTRPYFHRLMLHAYKLEFMHPESQKLLKLEAEIPSIFNKIN